MQAFHRITSLFAICTACAAPSASTSELAQGATTVGPYTISMFPNAPLVQGTRTTYTITIENDTAAATNLGAVAGFGSDTVIVVPAGCTKIGPSLLNCAAVPVAPGASVTYNPQITPATAGTVSYGASDFSVENGVTASQMDVTDTETVAPGATDLQITGSSNQGSPPVGSTFTYTFQVKNSGPFATVGDATFSDALPGSLAFGSVTTDHGTCTGGATVACTLGSLAVGVQATIKIGVSPDTATTIVNTATASLPAGQGDRNPANNSVSVTVTSH